MIVTETKQRILDVAEELFADQGFGGTSLRAIITAADVNLAAVHYHFRSKEALLEAVIVRRLEPLNRERLKLLDEYERQATKGGPSVEDILDAFLAPPVRFIRNTTEGCLYGKLLGRLHSEPGALFAGIARKHFLHVFQRFETAFRRALPDLPAADVFWRLHFAIGAMAHTLARSDVLEVMSGGVCKSSDAETAIPQLIDFLAAGFRASASSSGSRSSGKRRTHGEKRS
jgi:AcrR family transcriptional regulator